MRHFCLFARFHLSIRWLDGRPENMRQPGQHSLKRHAIRISFFLNYLCTILQAGDRISRTQALFQLEKSRNFQVLVNESVSH